MEKKTLVLDNEETLAYLHYPNEGKPTLLLLHGNMSSSVHYKPLIEQLKEDFTLLVPDMRGFGDSSYHKPIESLEDFADDCARFLTHFEHSPVVVIGWSTGGGVALKFAAKYPQLTKSIVLIESASYRGYPIYEKTQDLKPTKQLYTSKEAMAQDPLQVAPVAKALKENNFEFIKQVWLQTIYNVKAPQKDDLELYIHETLKQRNLIDVDWALMTFNMSDTQNGVAPGDGSIHDLEVRVLATWGQKDLVIPKPMFEENIAALKDVTPYVFEQGSHSPITDEPEALARLITTFIEKDI